MNNSLPDVCESSVDIDQKELTEALGQVGLAGLCEAQGISFPPDFVTVSALIDWTPFKMVVITVSRDIVDIYDIILVAPTGEDMHIFVRLAQKNGHLEIVRKSMILDELTYNSDNGIALARKLLVHNE